MIHTHLVSYPKGKMRFMEHTHPRGGLFHDHQSAGLYDWGRTQHSLIDKYDKQSQRRIRRTIIRNPSLSLPTPRPFAQFRVTTKLVRSKAYRPEHDVVISSPSSVYEAVKKLDDAPTEHLMAIYLDNKNRVNGIQQISKGERTTSLVPYDHILRTAILTNSSGIILAHNHPSGVETLSSDDVSTAKHLKTAAGQLGIALLDIVVIAEGKVESAAGRNLL